MHLKSSASGGRARMARAAASAAPGQGRFSAVGGGRGRLGDIRRVRAAPAPQHRPVPVVRRAARRRPGLSGPRRSASPQSPRRLILPGPRREGKALT